MLELHSTDVRSESMNHHEGLLIFNCYALLPAGLDTNSITITETKIIKPNIQKSIPSNNLSAAITR